MTHCYRPEVLETNSPGWATKMGMEDAKRAQERERLRDLAEWLEAMDSEQL
jgi:hypothetical protein